jgi:hypothetical protein
VGFGSEVIKRRRYGIRKLDFIRQALAGYAGGSAIISEMLQNADDAAASKAMFQFKAQDFLAWNDSIFSDQDWENLTSIASGGKRNEEGKIGTWGTGFLSVFHLTDIPEVNSAGEKLILDPREEFADVTSSNIKDGTGFRMEWRRKPSDISREIEADIWSDENIQVLKDSLAVSIYRQIIFLRNVNCIEVYEGDRWQEKLLYRVARTRKSMVQQSGYRCELWDIEYQRAGVQPRLDTWLFYRGNVPKHLMVEGVKPKDTETGIAFPIENREWLTKNLPGALYNFLPTPIQTGYSFHINGAFFPDNNRRTILIDLQTQREKSRWNLNVIDAIGDLFVEILPDIRDRLTEPRRFYEILPTQPPPPAQQFLGPIYESFCQAAPREKIVFSSLGAWSEPGEVSIGRPGSRLPELVADYLPIVPSRVPQTFRDFLTSTLKIPFLDWKDAIAVLNERVQPGVPVAEAHPMINSVEKLWLLYSELPVNPTDEQLRLFADATLCLGEDGKLWPFSGDIWRASEQTRSLLTYSGLLFVSLDAQKLYAQLLENLVAEMRGAELVEWLAKLKLPDTGISSSALPVIFESLDHLTDLISFIDDDLQRTNRDILKKLPIIYTEDGFLCTAESSVYFHNDAAECSDLQTLGLRFVHAGWAAKEEIREVYGRAGVHNLAPRHVIQALKDRPLTQANLSQPELIQQLLKIYGYLYRNRGQLDEVSKNELLSMPLCLTQRLRLTSVQEEQNRLHLPGDDALSKSAALRSLDKLQLDNLIHSDVLSGRSFLTQILGLRPLSEVDLIRDVIVQHYHDRRLDHIDRYNLLSYLSEQLRSLPSYQQNELWPELRTANLILCSNGEYHTAAQVYFTSPAIDTVFGSGYLKLHSDYQVPVPEPDDNDQAPYRQSVWYWLFENLGVNESPAASDLVRSIEQLTKINPPAENKVEAVRRLYDFLNSEIGDNKTYLSNPEIQRLSEIAWLPARNRSDRWYFPREIYQASLVYLIGEEAPLLVFRESREQLRSALRMPRYPDVGIVAKHLLDLAHKKKSLEENDLRIYQDLGNRWHDLSSPLQQNLITADVVWSSSRKRYWKPEQVFLANFGHLFGDRRSYLQSPGGDAQKFLSYLGVREEPHSYNDSLDLLNEIAQDYTDGIPVSDADNKLVYANLFHLSQFENHHIHDRLRKVKFMPANNGLLYELPQIALVDRRDLLVWFEEIDFPRLDQEKLTEPVYKLLRKSGMPLLSELIHRELIKIEGEQPDTVLNNQIPNLKSAFQRVALGAYQDDEEAKKRAFEAIDLLVNLEIFACDQIVVQYSLQNQNGWHTLGHQNTGEKSLLYKATNSLYVHRINKKLDNVQLALEIENLLFPGSKASIVIENLLEKKLAEINNFLDRHGYPIVLGENAPTHITSLTQGELDNWKIPSDASVEVEKTTNTGILSGPNTPVSTTPPDVKIEPKVQSAEVVQEDPIKVDQPSTENLPSETDETADQPDTSIPVFTGQTRPMVPVLPNDYDDLQRRYGLTLHSSEPGDYEDDILNSDRVNSDREWVDDKDAEKENGAITSTRFTLTFTNRYEGFLPLHQRARLMFPDHPSRLECKTDFPEWEFDFYIDYERQIIHNQEMLPKFFDAFKIPAGGIVYLERVHANHCRLFWKEDVSRVENVICLEILEDGTLSEYEIPSTEFPCELSEYVFRSEKRLEDAEALFRQAIGKKGVFQTICDVFGEAGRILSFDEIFHGVMKIRQVAKASILYQLKQRPCFVNLDNGSWRFEPQLGASEPNEKDKSVKPKHEHSIDAESGNEQLHSEEIKKPVEPALPVPAQITPPSAINLLLREIRRDLGQFENYLQEDINNPRERLFEITEKMLALATQWQAKLQALSSIDVQVDDTLRGFWESVSRDSRDQQRIMLLEQRIWELLVGIPINQLITQLLNLLIGTQEDIRPQFFMSLSSLAYQAFEQELFEQSLQIYQCLQLQGAGNFKDSIEKIGEQQRVQLRLKELEQEKVAADRFTLLQLAWEETPDFPSLRRVIQNEVDLSVIEQEKLFQLCFEEENFHEAYNQHCEWFKLILPLYLGWKNNSDLSVRIWELTYKLFAMLLKKASDTDAVEHYYLAYHVANLLPFEGQQLIPAADYLQIVLEIAQDYEKKDKIVEAAATLEFGLFAIKSSKRGLERYLNYRTYDYASRLFEGLGLLVKADNYLFEANRDATAEQKARISHRRYSLHEMMTNMSNEDKVKEMDIWIARLKSCANQDDFIKWLDPKKFKDCVENLTG